MRTILVICGDHLFACGVKRLLSAVSDLQVTSISEKDDEALLKSIEQLRPDVIVVEEKLQNSSLMQVLKPSHSNSVLRLVVINHKDNWIHVLQKKDILIQDHTDLVSAILQ